MILNNGLNCLFFITMLGLSTAFILGHAASNLTHPQWER